MSRLDKVTSWKNSVSFAGEAPSLETSISDEESGSQNDSFADQIAALWPVLNQRARLLAQDPDCADDLAQDTVERALKNRHQFRVGSNLRAWAMTIMRHLFIDERRRSRVEVPVGFDVSDEDVSAPTLGPLDLVDESDIRAALVTLSKRERALFDLAYWRAMSYRELALRFDIPVSTVGTRLLRTRLKLRAALETICSRRLRAAGRPK